MTYKVLTEDAAFKSLKKISTPERAKVIDKIKQLQNPGDLKANIKQLKRPLTGYRLRVGDYRILFTIDHSHREIIIYLIRHRRESYRAD